MPFRHAVSEKKPDRNRTVESSCRDTGRDAFNLAITSTMQTRTSVGTDVILASLPACGSKQTQTQGRQSQAGSKQVVMTQGTILTFSHEGIPSSNLGSTHVSMKWAVRQLPPQASHCIIVTSATPLFNLLTSLRLQLPLPIPLSPSPYPLNISPALRVRFLHHWRQHEAHFQGPSTWVPSP